MPTNIDPYLSAAISLANLFSKFKSFAAYLYPPGPPSDLTDRWAESLIDEATNSIRDYLEHRGARVAQLKRVHAPNVVRFGYMTETCYSEVAFQIAIQYIESIRLSTSLDVTAATSMIGMNYGADYRDGYGADEHAACWLSFAKCMPQLPSPDELAAAIRQEFVAASQLESTSAVTRPRPRDALRQFAKRLKQEGMTYEKIATEWNKVNPTDAVSTETIKNAIANAKRNK